MCQKQEMNYFVGICEGTVTSNFPQSCEKVMQTFKLTTVDAS